MTFSEMLWGAIQWEVNRKKKLGNIYCGLFLRIFYIICVIGAVTGIVLVVFYPGKKGWTKEHGKHTTTFKITGTASISGKTPGIWDAADLEDPPEQTNAFFLTTKIQRVPNQRFNSSCFTNRACKHDGDCKDIGIHHIRGRQQDGKCALGGYCVVRNTWCPLPEEEENKTNIDTRFVRDLSGISIVIRNTAFFSTAKFNVTNMLHDKHDLECT